MIEIKAKLVRADSPIYATGELFECLVEFTHRIFEKNDDDDGGATTSTTKVKNVENLAWACVQIHCYRKSQMQNKSQDIAELLGKTTLDAVTQTPGEVIIATKPKILFCDLTLQPGETKTYYFSETLPRDGPPTYQGVDIRYFYKVTIAAQRLKSKIQTLTVPIRVLPIPIAPRPDELPCTEETNEELAPTNPFLEKRDVTELEVSWHHLKNITARRAPKFYRISNKHGYVGCFCLFKPSYKLGEDIVGSLDFSKSKVRCIQFLVKLQSQEILRSKSKAAQSNAGAESSDSISVNSADVASIASGATMIPSQKHSTAGNSSRSDEDLTGKITSYTTNHQVCYAFLQTQIIVPIPLHVTPTFSTDLVDVRWRLHFEFVTSTSEEFFPTPSPSTGQINAPSKVPVETMSWNLPITVYAANPLQIYSANQNHSLAIK